MNRNLSISPSVYCLSFSLNLRTNISKMKIMQNIKNSFCRPFYIIIVKCRVQKKLSLFFLNEEKKTLKDIPQKLTEFHLCQSCFSIGMLIFSRIFKEQRLEWQGLLQKNSWRITSVSCLWWCTIRILGICADVDNNVIGQTYKQTIMSRTDIYLTVMYAVRNVRNPLQCKLFEFFTMMCSKFL